jgi:hypothetical protein
MQITIKGEMPLADIRKAIYEQLSELEQDFAIAYSQGATLYVNPTDGEGQEVVARSKDGKVVGKVTCNGPYKSAAEEFKL